MQIYNTLTRKKEEFIPQTPKKAGLYSCGPTVYNYFHIGNARPFIIFDTLRRYLEHIGYEVVFVQNFTDIDDKMINRANAEGITVRQLADKYIGEYHKDADALCIGRPTYAPKATEHIEDIIALISQLIEKGHAYEADGDVYYDAPSFEGYGKLSGQDIDALELGARIEPGDIKKNPMDFALWKAQKPGEPAWESPWGMGRPGWHIECSAMSMKYLGETFDIHSGGQDLIFPHHENEIAQSEGATGKPFARYWMHNGYININNAKMSKSAGNFFTVRDIISEFEPAVVRLFMLSAHYRNPINFGHDLLAQAKAALERLVNCRENLLFLIDHASSAGDIDDTLQNALDSRYKQFTDAMDDDLNTADALAAVFELARDINAFFADTANDNKLAAQAALDTLDKLLSVLGIQAQKNTVPDDIMQLAEARAQARKDKNWAESDRLRDEIKAKGYIVEDTPQGPKVKPV